MAYVCEAEDFGDVIGYFIELDNPEWRTWTQDMVDAWCTRVFGAPLIANYGSWWVGSDMPGWGRKKLLQFLRDRRIQLAWKDHTKSSPAVSRLSPP